MSESIDKTNASDIIVIFKWSLSINGVPPGTFIWLYSSFPDSTALNIVRRRAGLSDAPSLDMENEEYGVKAERRAELFYENSRYLDLVRWGEAATVLKDLGKKSPTFYGYQNGFNSESQSKEEWKIQYNSEIGIGFQANKNELFPIPNVEINNNPNLIQNPGW